MNLFRLAILAACFIVAGTVEARASVGTNIHPYWNCPSLPASVTYVRLDRHLDWVDDAAKFDTCMAILRTNGKQPIVTVVGNTNPMIYAASLAAMARQWPGTTWEIWNEQNTAYFWPGTIENYMVLLRKASRFIRAADPKATVLLGGLGYCDVAWLTRAYRLGLRGLVDGIAVHPYEAVINWPQALEQIRLVQWKYRDPGPKLWITEFGWWGATWLEAEKIALTAIEQFPYVQVAIWYDVDGLGL
jgi:hypothetical protein